MSIALDTYWRRCDECRHPYEHVKGAMTGWCPDCHGHLTQIAHDLPPLPHEHSYLPLIERVELRPHVPSRAAREPVP